MWVIKIEIIFLFLHDISQLLLMRMIIVMSWPEFYDKNNWTTCCTRNRTLGACYNHQMKTWEKNFFVEEIFSFRGDSTTDLFHIYSSSACGQTFRLGKKLRWMNFQTANKQTAHEVCNEIWNKNTRKTWRIRNSRCFTNHHGNCLKEFLNLVSAAHFHHTIFFLKINSQLNSKSQVRSPHNIQHDGREWVSVLHFFLFHHHSFSLPSKLALFECRV